MIRLRRILESPRAVLVGVAAGLTLFELLHRVVGTPQIATAVVLSALFLPILVSGILTTTSMVLSDPDNLGHALRYTFAFVFLTVVFFAVLYSELGIREAGVEIHDFWIALYFSVTTLTTLGYGDYVPTPETRVVAAVESLAGYVLLGLVVASSFAVLAHRSTRRSR